MAPAIRTSLPVIGYKFFSIPWTGQFDGIPGLTTFWNQVLSTHSFNEVHLHLENRKFRSQAETSFS